MLYFHLFEQKLGYKSHKKFYDPEDGFKSCHFNIANLKMPILFPSKSVEAFKLSAFSFPLN